MQASTPATAPGARIRALAVALLAILSAPAAAAPANPAAKAENRVALVIGNGAYRHAPALDNPARDARAVAASLDRLGFEVVKGIDLDHRALVETVHAFARKVTGADVAAFYYAGHGIQADGRNYLVPVDADLGHEADLAFETLDVERVLAHAMRGAKVRLVLLDACRDNPLARSLASRVGPTRSAGIGRGLAKIENARGTLIAFATEPGNVAYDGAGDHSPFTEALLRHIETPGTEINVVMTRVRRDVFEETDKRQLPWVNVSLTSEFYLKAADAAPGPLSGAKPQAPAVATAAPGGTDIAWQRERTFWASVERGGTAGEYHAYLAAFPDGHFRAIAESRLAALGHDGPPAPATDAPAATTADADRDRDGPRSGAAEGTQAVATAPEGPDETDEAALSLTRQDRREIQRRLKLAGHDPRGIDGIFGPKTRAAIGAWQAATGRPGSRYLDEEQVRALEAATKTAYADWLAAVERQRAARAEAERKRKAAAAAERRRAAAAAERRRAAAAKSRSARPAATRSAPPRQPQVVRRTAPRRVVTTPYAGPYAATPVYRVAPAPAHRAPPRQRSGAGAAIGAAVGLAIGGAAIGLMK